MALPFPAPVGLKTLMSADKFRFTEGGFDLDLSYITERVIAMGYPTSGIKAAWRNSVDDVARMLRSYHDTHFMIYDLTMQRAYDYAKFDNQVRSVGWPDHHPPPLDHLWTVMKDIETFLNSDPKNVVVIHCHAGRGRTGTCEHLISGRVCNTTEQALEIFAQKRSVKGYNLFVLGILIPNRKGVTVASQRRYVDYVRQIVNGNVPTWHPGVKCPLKLKHIILRKCPPINFNPTLEILGLKFPHKKIFPHKRVKISREAENEYDTITLDIDCVLDGDILVRFYERFSSAFRIYCFMFSFHTFFLEGHTLQLVKDTLDAPNGGNLKDQRFTSLFSATAVFSDPTKPGKTTKPQKPDVHFKKQRKPFKASL